MGVREQCVKKYGRGICGSYYLRKSKVIILKIDIVGSVASGKTTLARKISKEFNIPHYEKDNVVWKRTPSGDVKRTPQERDAYFNDIISKRGIYKEDYASITTYFQRKPISYGETIKSVEIIAISRS